MGSENGGGRHGAPPHRDHGHLVLGAGCAGLGLALALLDAGVREPITVVDRRTRFDRDRTWCLWDDGRGTWSARARHRWQRWEVITSDGRAGHRSARRPYVHLDAADVYSAALERLAAAPHVTLRLGERVADFGATPSSAWVELATGERLEGAWVHDALGLGSPSVDAGAVGLWQEFLGLDVVCERPVFDPRCATLMDFRVPQDHGLRFLYVLPYDRCRALVEDTSIAPGRRPPAERRALVLDHLRARGAGAVEVVHEERGRLPMDGAVGAPGGGGRGGERRTAVGIAGGAVRPSSGYAFGRIQQQVRAVAAAVAAARTPPPFASPGRAAAMDALFLRVLAAAPATFPAHFLALVRHVPADAFARFLSDAATPWDEARVAAALVPGGLRGVAAAARAGSPG